MCNHKKAADTGYRIGMMKERVLNIKGAEKCSLERTNQMDDLSFKGYNDAIHTGGIQGRQLSHQPKLSKVLIDLMLVPITWVKNTDDNKNDFCILSLSLKGQQISSREAAQGAY